MYLQRRKNPARGPYRKKLERSRARDQPIRCEDLGFRPAQMLKKKQNLFILFNTKIIHFAQKRMCFRPSHVGCQRKVSTCPRKKRYSTALAGTCRRSLGILRQVSLVGCIS